MTDERPITPDDIAEARAALARLEVARTRMRTTETWAEKRWPTRRPAHPIVLALRAANRGLQEVQNAISYEFGFYLEDEDDTSTTP